MNENNKPKWSILEEIPDGFAVIDLKFKAYKHQLDDIKKFLEKTSDSQLAQTFSCYETIYDLFAQKEHTDEKVKIEVEKALQPLNERLAKLYKDIIELKKTLYLRDIEIQDANQELDAMGVDDVSPEFGHAFVGHRLQWFRKKNDSQK